MVEDSLSVVDSAVDVALDGSVALDVSPPSIDGVPSVLDDIELLDFSRPELSVEPEDAEVTM
jgi:hypothetical protein